jgi:hypothetical protein
MIRLMLRRFALTDLFRPFLTISPPFAPFSYCSDLSAISTNGTEVRLKASAPNRDMSTEIDALRFRDDRGAG